MKGSGAPRLVSIGWALVFFVWPARAQMEQAISHLKAGNYLEAAAELQVLVDRSPDYDYGYYLLGHCHLKTGNPHEAERSFARALALNGRRPEYYHGLALALKEQRQYQRALEVVSSGEPLAREPDWRFAFLSLRAAVEVSLHRWEEAAADMEKAVALRRDPRLFRDLGRVYLVLGKNDRAAAAFAQAAAASPADPSLGAWLVEATLRMAAQSTDGSRKRSLYAQALKLARDYEARHPEQAAAANLLGRAALGAGRYEEAEAAFRKVLAADPGHCYARVNLAGAYIAQQRWQEAERSLLEATRCGSELGETYVRLGYVYLRQGRQAEAEQAFERAHALLPSPAGRRLLARASAAAGEGGRSGPARPAPVLRPAGAARGRSGEVLVLDRKSD